MSGTAKKISGGADSFQTFIKPWAQHALLTKEQEYDLIRRAQEEERIRLARAKEAKKQAVKGLPPASRPRTTPTAMEELVNANVRMLLSYAQKFREAGQRRGIYLEDLFALAAIGLRKAVLKFDFSKDCRLTTYGGWWIRQELVRSVQDLGATIRIPAHVGDRSRKLRQISAQYQTEFGREPDFAALRRLSGFSKSQVSYAMSVPQEPSSLDKPAHGHHGEGDLAVAMIDLMLDPDHEQHSPEADLERSEQRRRLNEAIWSLRPMERLIIECRFQKDLTLEETAGMLAKPDEQPLSRERIRQIETVALKKLRKFLRG